MSTLVKRPGSSDKPTHADILRFEQIISRALGEGQNKMPPEIPAAVLEAILCARFDGGSTLDEDDVLLACWLLELKPPRRTLDLIARQFQGMTPEVLVDIILA